MVQVDEVRGWIDRTVLDSSGNKVGSVSQIYVDDTTNRPEWATVNTGLFGRRVSFIPLEGVRQQGDDLVIPWDREQVRAAPQVDNDDGHLAPEEEVQLYRHYAHEQRSAADVDGDAQGEATADARASDREASDREGSQSPAGPAAAESGQARLRRYVVTEEVHPVSRVLLDDSPAHDSGERSNDQEQTH
jgi:sporulation protein YlmC with PRC-barrel domain